MGKSSWRETIKLNSPKMFNFTSDVLKRQWLSVQWKVLINMRYISCLHWVYGLFRETDHKCVKNEITKLKNSPEDLQKKN